MRKLKLLFAACAILMGAGQAWAQTDVTSTYITNADFSSTDGWTQYHSSQYYSLGSGFIGKYCVANNYTSTTDDSHLSTEYCLGIQCRWNTNYAAFQQTKENASLVTGTYTVTFDVQNTNTATANGASYGNLFYVKVGDNTYYDSSTEWQSSHPSWTSHSISFSIEEATTANITFSFGYQLNTNNGSGATPHIYVSHLSMSWTDPEAAAHAAALEAAKYTLNGHIKKATALNGVLTDATLATAIETAQSVYDAADDYTEDYNNTVNAYTTLSAAVTTALRGATAVSLTNANFDTTPNNTLDGANTVFGGTLSTATSNPDNTKDFSANTGDHAYLYEVSGWTQYSKFNATASQGTTSEYGTAMPANGWSTNGTTPPATDMFGGNTGAALHLSAGWGDQARYQQTIENLPSGRYVMYYEVINQHSNTGIASNYIGVNGAAGDFYGTSTAYVYSGLKTIEQGVWKAQAFKFDVAKTADVNFSVGVTTSTGGSANGAKLWIDNVLVYRIGDITMSDEEANAILADVALLDNVVYNATDKNALASAKSTFESNKNIDNYNALNAALIAAQASVAVYTALDAAITKVEGWTATTAAEGIRAKYTNGEYTNETTADIYTAYQAAEIAALTAASATDFTSVILNHSFETGDMTGWSAEGRNDTGVKENSNSTYTINNGVDGSYIFNSWGGTAENNVYQTIANLPAGTYQLSALLAGFTGEELVLAAYETTNSVTVEGDKTTGNIVNVIFTLTEAGNVIIKASNTKKDGGSSDASFIKADNFTLKAYSDPLAALKEQLSTLQEQATATLNNSDYENVTGEEYTTLTTLSTFVPDETEEAYNTAISNISTAISAFTAAKAVYDAYVEIRGIAVALDVTPGDAPANADAAPAATHALNVAVYNATTADNIFDVTDVYAPSWTSMGTSSGQHWSGDTGISYADEWRGDTNPTTRTTTVTLPEGKYILMSAGRGSSNTVTTMSANGTTVTFASNGDMGIGINKLGAASFDAEDAAGFANKDGQAENTGTGWEWRYIPVELSEETAVTVTQTLTRLSGSAWGSFSDFRILKQGEVAGAEDYAALNSAIEAADAKTLGFENGQFAPYNNVAALDALAAAKALDQTVTNEKETVETVTTSLTSATWTPNEGDVDAIYNGTFAETGTGSNPKGWTRSNNAWGMQITGLTTETNGVAEGTTTAWYYNNNGAWQYGNDGVYTMPLASNTKYVLSFKYRKHNNDWQSWMKASVVNSDNEGLEVAQFPGAENGTTFQSAKAYFTTGAAGNYILSIEQNGNAHLTDVSLVKAESTEYALSEEATAAPAEMAYYETVTLTRTLKAGIWNTFSVPFDAAIPEGWTVKEFVNAEDNTLNFSAATKIEAGVPYLVKTNTNNDVENLTFNGVIVKATEGETNGTGDYKFAAQIYNKTLDTNGTIAYLATDGSIKKLTSGGIKGLRAYFIVPASGAPARIAFIDDGDVTTGIESMESAAQKVENGVYDMQGRRVEAMKKGLYIVNGKKVVK